MDKVKRWLTPHTWSKMIDHAGDCYMEDLLPTRVTTYWSSSYKVMCSCATSAELTCEVISAGVYITQDLLAATITVSAFALIGPATCYAGVHTQAESVCQNCVRKMCLLVFNHSATSPMLIFWKFGYKANFKLNWIRSGCWGRSVTQHWQAER